jgi:large subunit ribosomal protein L28
VNATALLRVAIAYPSLFLSAILILKLILGFAHPTGRKTQYQFQNENCCFIVFTLPDSFLGAIMVSRAYPSFKKAMSRKCQLTGKKANNAYAVSHSHRRTKKMQGVNLQEKRIWWEEGKRWVKLRLSTKAIKTLEHKGLAAMAKEAGLDLKKF